MRRFLHPFFFRLPLLLAALNCESVQPETKSLPWLEFEWPEADRLFQKNDYWIGGDGAYSVDLGSGRILWMFGDSWIDTSGLGRRENAVMVSNTLALQEGYDPVSAKIQFFWHNRSGVAKAFFPDFNGGRYWPGHGVRVGNKLLLFLMGVYSSEGGLGFEVKDWTPLIIRNPDDDPDAWDMKNFPQKSNDLQIIIGSGGVIEMDGYVYAFGAQELASKHDIYLARWLVEDILREKLDHMQWWAGDQRGWKALTDYDADPVPVFSDGQTEFTVHYDAEDSLFIEIQTVGFGTAVIVRRTAADITGPWSPAEPIFSPEQNSFTGIMIYQGKAHPYLTGAKLVVTYCTNSFDFADQIKQSWLYYPRFVRIN